MKTGWTWERGERCFRDDTQVSTFGNWVENCLEKNVFGFRDRSCQTQFWAHWGRDAHRMPEVDTQYVESNMALELSIKVGLSHQHLDANQSHGNAGDHPVCRGRDNIQCWDTASYWKLRSGRKTRKGWCLWSEGEYIF